MDSDWLINWIK